MATNVVGNRPNVMIANVTKTFTEMGLNSTTIAIIYEIANTIKSWNPANSFNPLNGVTVGNGYWIVPKMNLDLTAYFSPPYPDNISFEYVIDTDGELKV